MKKVRIPFNKYDYQEGCYTVETRGDEKHKPHPVKIFTVDLLNKNQTIVGAEKIKNREVVGCWFYNGNYLSEDEENFQDLLLVKEEFENGDIVVGGNYDYSQTSIFKHYDDEEHSIAIIYNMYSKDNFILNEEFWCSVKNLRLATVNEKKEFFDALENINKTNTTNSKKKSLNYLDVCLMKNDNDLWCLCQYSNIRTDGKFTAVGGNTFKYCIPFNEDTKHLLGKTDDVPKKYEK